MTARKLHRMLAFGLAVFIAGHLLHHAALVVSVDLHWSLQQSLRPLYRTAVVEPILIAAVAVQVVLGLRLAWRRGWPRRFWPRIQVVSGVILALFLLQHVTAVLVTRAMETEIDTTGWWAASVVSRVETAIYFAPYYALGIASVFAHVAAHLAMRRRPGAALLLVGFGAVYGVLIVAALMGAFDPVTLPPAYADYVARMVPW